jgi:hypothetical protein
MSRLKIAFTVLSIRIANIENPKLAKSQNSQLKSINWLIFSNKTVSVKIYVHLYLLKKINKSF